MKRYPAYKDCSVDLIGEIPHHWELTKVKYLSDKRVEYGLNIGSENYVDTGVRFIRTTDIDDCGKIISDGVFLSDTDVEEQYRLQKGDFLISRSGTIGRAYVHYNTDMPYSFAGYLVRFSFPYIELSEFIYYMTKSGLFSEWLSSISIESTIGNVNGQKYANFQLPLPNKNEVKHIVKYLDHKTHLIDTLIEKKQKQIELLREQRFALVHDAIQDTSTRNIPMKYVVDQVFRPVARRDDLMYIPVGLYNRGRGIFKKEPTIGADLGDSDFFWIKKDDLVLSGQFAWEGAVALTSEEDSGCVATHRYPIFRGKTYGMETAYLFAYFTTREGDFLLNQHSRGAAGRNRPLNAGTLLKEPIPVPPIPAQARVSAHVLFEHQFVPIVKRSIQHLKEYRTTLISEVVTGKIDVRDEVIP